MFVTKAVRLAYARGQLLVIVAQLSQQVERRYGVSVIVQNSPRPRDMGNGAQCRGMRFSDPFIDRIGGGKDWLPCSLNGR